MLSRLLLALPVTFLASCAGPSSSPFSPPPSVAEWKIESVSTLSSGDVPATVGGLAVEEAVVARYTGPQPLAVTFCRMKTWAGAFEAMQHWRPEPGRLAFNRGPWFVVLDSPELDFARLNSIAGFLQPALVAPVE